MKELIHSQLFLIMSLLSSILAAVSAGIVGTFVVIKRIAFLTGSLSHAILGGMGLFLFLQRTYDLPYLTPGLGAFVTAVISAFILSIGHYKLKEREDTLISIIWSFGMSIGIIFLGITPGTSIDLLNYLFGNLLWSTNTDIFILCGLVITVTLFATGHYHELVALCFDEKQASLSGVDCKKLFIKLLILIGIVTVFLIKTVGAILVMSMLTIPSATACHFAKNVKGVIYLSITLGVFYSTAGVILAYLLNWPPGATITLLASVAYSATKLGTFKRLKRADFLPNRTKNT